MQHIVFAERDTYPVCILIKASSLKKQQILDNYIQPLKILGIQKEEVIIFTAEYNDKGKAPVSFIKQYLASLGKALANLETKLIYVTDGAYFKPMAGVKKLEGHYGYRIPCKIEGMDQDLVMGVSFAALFHNPDLTIKMQQTLEVLADCHLGRYKEPGTGIVHSEEYPESLSDIESWLKKLLNYPKLACDIEAFSLNVHKAGIGTIAFSWDEHNGVAFNCDYSPLQEVTEEAHYGANVVNTQVRALLLWFFTEYTGELIYHGVTYDAKILAYNLFMNDPLDYENQLLGVDVMTKNIHCTKILTYLATNNCVRNKLGLKDIAQEFAGNWAEDEIKDIRKIEPKKLLKYNLMDCFATFYVFNKQVPIVVADQQEQVYRELFIPAVPVVINAEITGMPMCDTYIRKLEVTLDKVLKAMQTVLDRSPLVEEFRQILQYDKFIETNEGWKTKSEPIEYFNDTAFKASSGKQLRKLLHEHWSFEIHSTTDTGMPAVGAKELERHLNILIKEHGITEDEYKT